MIRPRRRLIVASVLVLTCAAMLAGAWLCLCPVCHLGIVRAPKAVASVGDAEPRKNLAIWNGSYHGPDYEDYSKICTRCWMAYHSKLDFWERAVESPDAFLRPLSSAVRRVPLPPAEHIHYSVVYTQYFHDRQFGESVAFWCDDVLEVIQPLREYAAAHGLIYKGDRLHRQDGQQFVSIETNPPTI